MCHASLGQHALALEAAKKARDASDIEREPEIRRMVSTWLEGEGDER
jgi:hypothetical protein